MYAEAMHKSRLRKACYVSGFGAAFQAVYENYLTARDIRLVFESNNCCARIDLIQLANGRKALDVYFTWPIISSNR